MKYTLRNKVNKQNFLQENFIIWPVSLSTQNSNIHAAECQQSNKCFRWLIYKVQDLVSNFYIVSLKKFYTSICEVLHFYAKKYRMALTWNQFHNKRRNFFTFTEISYL